MVKCITITVEGSEGKKWVAHGCIFDRSIPFASFAPAAMFAYSIFSSLFRRTTRPRFLKILVVHQRVLSDQLLHLAITIFISLGANSKTSLLVGKSRSLMTLIRSTVPG